jgi:outer membrane protein OmpA-like peptidoglycan-associated protein
MAIGQWIRHRGRFFLYSSGVLVLLGAPGCVATRGWVQEQMSPISGRLTNMEARLGQHERHVTQVNGKADRALDRLDNLRLERRFVLTLRDGAHFEFDSALLTPEAQRQIDRFIAELKGAEETLLIVAGHTDNIGAEDYNFELGQKRAASVARYLIGYKGVDPLRVTAISYGSTAPVADNRTREGRRKNRRIEILVYKENITSSVEGQRLDLERTGGLRSGF